MPFEHKVYFGSSTGAVVEGVSHRPDLTRDEVAIETTHSGVCGTDEHFKYAPVGLGHEGVGVVKAIGPEVVNLKVSSLTPGGDRVGWGYVTNSCGQCDQCKSGWTINCTGVVEMYGIGASDQGSFSTGVIRHEGHLIPIPDGLSSAAAAPLMCGGITVWAALALSGNVKPTDVVGVVGIGGLGHLAIQFANAMGCTVVAFSTSNSKEEEAKKLGATYFVTMEELKGETKLPVKLDQLVVTTSVLPDWNLFLPILNPRATVYPESITSFEEKFSVPHMLFLLKGIKIYYATGAPYIGFKQMLDFAVRHNIAPIIEKFPLNLKGIEDSLKKLDSGKMRYRGVLFADGQE